METVECGVQKKTQQPEEEAGGGPGLHQQHGGGGKVRPAHVLSPLPPQDDEMVEKKKVFSPVLPFGDPKFYSPPPVPQRTRKKEDAPQDVHRTLALNVAFQMRAAQDANAAAALVNPAAAAPVNPAAPVNRPPT